MSETQAAFEFRTWGGRRDGAGRKPTRAGRAVPHRQREDFRSYQPVHVTIRVADWVWNLRSQRSFAIIHGAVGDVRARSDFRIADYSIQGNHLHLVIEAKGPRALGDGMRALSIRLARRLNRRMGRRGPVLEDRYHVHVLRTPAETQNALRYVLGNFASHAARRGEKVSPAWVDPYTSATLRQPRTGQGTLWPEPVTRDAETWLLRSAGARVRGAGGAMTLVRGRRTSRTGRG